MLRDLHVLTHACPTRGSSDLIFGAGVAAGTGRSCFPGVGVWVVSPIIPGSRNCCSLIPGPGLDKLPDKPTVSAHAPEKPMFALPDHHLVTLRGRDAAAFAQAQFMSAVRSEERRVGKECVSQCRSRCTPSN